MNNTIDSVNINHTPTNEVGAESDSPNIEKDEFGSLGDPYAKTYGSKLPRGADKSVLPSGDIKTNNAPMLPHSQFSDYHLFRFKTVNGVNYPLTNVASKEHLKTLYANITPQDLIGRKDMGAAVYKPEDFIYVERLKKLPINKMITLRRFAFPVVDDIFSVNSIDGEPDVARMIAFTDQETNKLSEVMSFSLGMNWKELTSTMEQINMSGGGNEGISGYMKKVIGLVDPTFGQDRLSGNNALNFNPLHDTNKSYGAVDSISKTHIRDVGLNFDQDIKLVFKYKMRSFNGVNGKAAFMDLLSSILVCTTNDAKFWGGSRFWLGRRPTKYMNNLKFLSPRNFDDFLNGAQESFKSFLGGGSGDTKKDNVNLLKNVASNAFNMGFGKLLDKIGRPGIPYMNSLLTGNPVGEWHVTLGNPLNPTMAIGNLILMNTSISFGDILGRDDFPEDITVECTLKHAMPRGRAEIEQMFNFGRGRMYWKPNDVLNSLGEGNSYKIPSNGESAKDMLDAAKNGGLPQDSETLNNFLIKSKTKFGKFDKASVLRNAEKVYSFEQLDKK